MKVALRKRNLPFEFQAEVRVFFDRVVKRIVL
jgi:hypothetical protein